MARPHMSSPPEPSDDGPVLPPLSLAGLLAGTEAAGVLFERHPDPMWVYDVDTLRILAVNAAALAGYGYSRQEFLGLTVADVRHPTERLRPVGAGTRRGAPGTWRHRRKDGSVIDVEITSVPFAVEGRPVRLVLARDVSEERLLSAALRQSEERFRSVFAHAPVAQMTLSADGRLVQVNTAFCILADRDERDLLGVRLDGLLGDGERLVESLAAAARGDIDVFQVDDRLLRDDAPDVEIQLTASVVRDDDGALQYVVALMQDVTEHREVQQTLAARALTDPLTGLPNRILFLERLDKALHRLQGGGESVAVLFIDLDRFKLVNDSLGHAAGDEVLLALTHRLRNSVTRNDTIARFGGDEFTVLCEGVPGSAVAMRIARRVLDMLSAPLVVDGEERAFTVSIGVAVAGPDDHVTSDFLMQGADSAMYRAKQNGRNRCELFDQASRTRTIALLQRADEMAHALHHNQLCLHYQPMASLHGDAARDVEALLRWQHPELGLLRPHEFIEVAEETRLIVQIGAWVIEQACQDIASLGPPGSGEAMGVAVNLSARQLARTDLVDVVQDALDGNGLEPSRLCLEITETVLMEDLEWSIDALRALKALGVRLAIDDFGTGYSSLNYLRRLPVDVVKIDRSFVAGLGADPAADAIVAAVINLSHALGLKVVAEGVERQEQLVALRALGCDHAQGFYWSPPVSFTELRQALVSDVSVVEHLPVDVRPLLRERSTEVRERTGRAILLRGPARLPAAVADPSALRIVLDHLLGNAMRFSPPERPIVVSVSHDRRWVRISVSDFGVGMTDAEMSRCFEPFWHGRNGNGGRGGTGIGLYIVRSLAEKMGGLVWVRSSPGKGSTFTVALPRSGTGHGTDARRGPRWDRGEQTVIQEFMRQLGVPRRREA